uniref:laccase n=1 Tax=Psilocybe cubensis TaxID=181762 RepID=A0A8H7XYK1_PSICU
MVISVSPIFSGQRYSFILTADQPVDNYWIRANPGPTGTTGFDGGINSAILRYVNATAEDPTTNSTASNPLVETNLVPLDGAAAPGTPGVGLADVNIDLEFSFNGTMFTVNDAAWTTPTVPVLLQIMSGTLTAQDLLPSGSFYVLPPNKVIEISMPGGSAGAPHPLHLHGHTFSVVRSAGNSSYNYVNPIRRDVVNTGSDTTDSVTIRFTTDNAGPWFLHCHIDWHLDVGFAVVMAEDVDTVEGSTPSSDWSTLCPTFDALPVQTFT